MIPSKKEWAKWDTIKRATFLGFPIALVATIIALLTWQTSSESNLLQRQLFSATNQPILQLTNINFASMEDGSSHARFTIKNIGESRAYGICIGLYQVTKNGKHLHTDYILRETCSKNNRPSSFGLVQGLENSSLIVSSSELEFRLGYEPHKAKIITGDPSSDFFLFNIFWKDVTGTENRSMQMLQFSK